MAEENGSDKRKIISIRLSPNSDLADRMKALAKRAALPYSALLEKWIETEESEPRARGRGAVKSEAKWKDEVDRQISRLQSQVAALEGKPASRSKASETSKAPRGKMKSGRKARGRPGTEISENLSETQRELLQKIGDLRREGLPYSKIADRLNSEGVATISGSGKWYPSSISTFLQKNKA
jgi:hypothetical protein